MAEAKHLVKLPMEQWDIVQEALALYMAVNSWNDQGHRTSDIEDVSFAVYNELQPY